MAEVTTKRLCSAFDDIAASDADGRESDQTDGARLPRCLLAPPLDGVAQGACPDPHENASA